MIVGVELGWLGVRVVTVGDRQEVLSVSDASSASVVTTPPVVAVSAGYDGVLVGRPAIEISGDDVGDRPLSSVHAYTATVDGPLSPLPILLEKVARDIKGFGSSIDNMTFVVSEDMVPRSATWTPEGPQLGALESAATMAGIAKFNLAYRAEAAAFQGQSLLPDGALGDAIDSGRVIVVDVGPRSVRVSTVILRFKVGDKSADSAETMEVESTDLGKWAGVGAGARDAGVELFGHFLVSVRKQVPGFFSLAALDELWQKLMNHRLGGYIPLLDKSGRQYTFDVDQWRADMGASLTDTVRSLLAKLRWGVNDVKLVVIIGSLATLPGSRAAIQAAFTGGFTGGFIQLTEFSLAGAVRFPNLKKYPFGRGRAEAPAALSTLPINDGMRQRPLEADEGDVDDGDDSGVLIDEGEDPNNPWPKGKLTPFSDVVDNTFNVAAAMEQPPATAGSMIGRYWAAKTDYLLRLRASAPEVDSASLYDFHLSENKLRSGEFDPAALKRIVEWVGTRKRKPDLSGNGEENFNEGFRKGYDEFLALVPREKRAAEGAAANNLAKTQPHRFDDYIAKAQAATIPEKRKLALVLGGEKAAPIAGSGIYVSGNEVLSMALEKTAPGETTNRTLGFNSDGYRSLLASDVRAAPRRGFPEFVNRLVGGGANPGQLIWLGLLLVLSAIIAGVVWWPHPPVDGSAPTIVEGNLDCPNPDGAAATTCTGDGPVVEAMTAMPQGCVVNVLRVVGPAANGPLTDYSVSPPAPAGRDARCATIYDGLKRALPDAFTAWDSSISSEVSTWTTGELADRYAFKRDVVLSDGTGGITVTDIVWVAYNLETPKAALNGQWTITLAPGNQRDVLVERRLCVDLGVRMQVMSGAAASGPLGGTAVDHISRFLADPPEKDLSFVRFHVREAPAPSDTELGPIELFPSLEAQAAAGPYTLLVDPTASLWSVPGHPRLIGRCVDAT